MAASPQALGERRPPLAVAIYLVCRNLVPVVGVLFLGWSARQQLVLYFLDTLLALAVLFALALAYFFPIDNEEGLAARINSAGGVFGFSFFITAFMAVPLGVPLVFVLGPGGFSWAEFATQSFAVAALVHLALALLTFVALYREMRALPDAGTAIKRQMPWALFRWIAVIFAVYTGLPMMLGELGGLLLVVIYALCGIAADIAPGRVAKALRVAA